MYLVLRKDGAEFCCDTLAEVAQVAGRQRAVVVRSGPDQHSSAYRAGQAAAHAALRASGSRAGDALGGLPLHQTFVVRGHEVRSVGMGFYVVDGKRMGKATAHKRLMG